MPANLETGQMTDFKNNTLRINYLRDTNGSIDRF